MSHPLRFLCEELWPASGSVVVGSAEVPPFAFQTVSVQRNAAYFCSSSSRTRRQVSQAYAEEGLRPDAAYRCGELHTTASEGTVRALDDGGDAHRPWVPGTDKRLWSAVFPEIRYIRYIRRNTAQYFISDVVSSGSDAIERSAARRLSHADVLRQPWEACWRRGRQGLRLRKESIQQRCE